MNDDSINKEELMNEFRSALRRVLENSEDLQEVLRKIGDQGYKAIVSVVVGFNFLENEKKNKLRYEEVEDLFSLTEEDKAFLKSLNINDED